MTDTFRDRDVLHRIPVPAVMHYTAAASPVPTAAGDGLTLTGDSYHAPIDVPAATDWPAHAPGTSHACALLPAGVYLIGMGYEAHGNDVDGIAAQVGIVDTDAVRVFTGETERFMMLVAAAPVRLYAAAHADNDDATRVVDLDLWVTRVGAL